MHTRKYAKERHLNIQEAIKSHLHTVLIMSPWNYPLMLTLEPLVGVYFFKFPNNFSFGECFDVCGTGIAC